ncbi:MAG: hypothetical protein CMP23_02635 [Rickettsiales bacterium]|nr:hypothetical protein [Rickettsiales bacterium]
MSTPKPSTELSTERLEKSDNQPSFAAVILAAGRGRRMGRNKASLPWGRQSLLGAWIDRFIGAGASQIAAVLGPDGAAVRTLCEDRDELVWACNSDPDGSGPRESLLCGIAALSTSGPLWFVPVDVPVVQAQTLNEIAQCYRSYQAREGGPPLAAMPSYRGVSGHPVLAGSDLIKMLQQGEPGDRIDELLSWATRRIARVDTEDVCVVGNMNRPEDYQAYAPVSQGSNHAGDDEDTLEPSEP